MSRDTFLSLIMRRVLKERTMGEGNNSKNMPEKYHPHPLVLMMVDVTTQESVCNACIQPISPPYYRCSAQSECNFLLHKFCADLPLVISDSFYQSEFMASLASPIWDEHIFSHFRCKFCHMYCNGFGYSYSERISIVACLECALAPKVIRHDSHRQHPLILIGYCPFEASISCCGNEHRFSLYVYNCSVCDYNIDIHCAFLPKTVTHKFDEHPLTLVFASSSQHHSDSTECFCEFCEEDIDPMYWFYHCAECDQSFHVDCIPSLGKFSKIKFGTGTVKHPSHNDHPLSLVRMLSIGNQICGICHYIIEGFEDGMALHCADCDFWIHFLCGDRFPEVQVTHPYMNFSFLPT
ncbi:uncharacterized protein [Henckelia pumila]|uniref:uncharacterized protein n=1 Tax=Henckelia pumila TaxID=405737 RepID=UPI003C6DD9EE